MAIETTEEHLKVFSEACLKYQKEFGLSNWELHFKLDDIERDISQISYNLEGYIAVLILCQKWDDTYIELTSSALVETARHEMLHLLLARLSSYALIRSIIAGVIHEADEEIVRRLEYILDEMKERKVMPLSQVISFNINHYVEVCLTEKGAAVWNEKVVKPGHGQKLVKPGETIKEQLFAIMSILGEHCSCLEIPIEPEIRIHLEGKYRLKEES